ncbi:DUF4328 domain-containing protein [Kitasatospora mediocidica]|uniref:DUF4328 domain-containing protein n=1 Tax=Kitasatospora mediocidica TaxID=58352 RepID=UPI00068A7077|nr:DUF4328 domain-containing protein [Kitasatospora mediocidica]
MASIQPVDPREPATNLKVLTGLTNVCLVLIYTAFLYSPSPAVLGLLFLLTLGAMAASFIVRSVWIRRCWTNAEVLAPGSQRSSRSWAVGVWFIPLVQLWLPRRVTLDIRRASGLPDNGTVNLWWGVSVATFVIGTAAGVRSLHQVAILVACALALVKAVAFIRIIGQVTSHQVEALNLPPIPELGERASRRA